MGENMDTRPSSGSDMGGKQEDKAGQEVRRKVVFCSGEFHIKTVTKKKKKKCFHDQFCCTPATLINSCMSLPSCSLHLVFLED